MQYHATNLTFAENQTLKAQENSSLICLMLFLSYTIPWICVVLMPSIIKSTPLYNYFRHSRLKLACI